MSRAFLSEGITSYLCLLLPIAVLTRRLRAQDAANTSYQAHVNPQWVRLLELLQMNARYVECRGEKLRTEDGRTILDFLSGYCVYNIGHNHPAVIRGAARRA